MIFITGILGIDIWLIVSKQQNELHTQAQLDLNLLEIYYRTYFNNKEVGIPHPSDTQANHHQLKLAMLKFMNGGYSAIYSPDEIGIFTRAFQNENNFSELLSNQTELETNFKLIKQNQLKIKNSPISDTSILNQIEAAAGQPITYRILVENQTYTIAAKSINNNAGEPIAILVRGIPESLINALISDKIILKITVLSLFITIQILLIIIGQKYLNYYPKTPANAKKIALETWEDRAIVNAFNSEYPSSDKLNNINFLKLQQKIREDPKEEIEFQKNNVMLEAIINNPTAVIYIQDMQGKYLFVNPHFEEIFNLKKEEIIGKTDYELFSKELADSSREIHQIVAKAKKTLTIEEILPKKDGYNSYVSIKFPLEDVDGVPYAIGSISTNINYRKEIQVLLASVNEELENRVAERTAFLKQANQLLRMEIGEKIKANKKSEKMTIELEQHSRTVDSIINASVDLIYLFDLSGKYTYVSRNGAEALGKKPSDMIGKRVKDLGFSQEIIQEFDQQIKKVLTTSKAVKSEACFSTVKGVRDYEYILSPVSNQEGKIEAIVSIFRDITERRHTELELQLAKEAADVANQAKSAFIANISHELKTPLTAIIGYSDLLAEEIIELADRDLINDLNKIRSESNHLLKMIQEIIDLSKIESNKMKLYLEDFYLSSLVDNVIKSVQDLVIKNGNILRVQGVEEIGIMYADPIKVQQIISNLLTNAAKFTHQGEITLRVTRQENKIVFYVTDNGIGMSLDQIKYLFRPFTQADESTTRQYEGTGLGLAISQRLCKMMGGKITVDSKVGVGSTFTVYLPIEVQDTNSRKLLEANKSVSDLNEL
ncbi:MAG: ATP-binding protein [Microcoleaceae cyanobacterium]